MTVYELIEALQQFPMEAEVRLAQQPKWPFEYGIGQVIDNPANQVVYIGEGEQMGYLPRSAEEALGWK